MGLIFIDFQNAKSGASGFKNQRPQSVQPKTDEFVKIKPSQYTRFLEEKRNEYLSKISLFRVNIANASKFELLLTW